MRDLHYEELRQDLEKLRVPDGQTRSLQWLAPTLAVGRTASGDYEIFIRGSEVRAASPLVRRHVQHSEWRPEEGGEPFQANRIVLPAAHHFASIAALISIELLRAGIAGLSGPQAAFTDVEPIIELAIRRGALPENVVVGLIGELIVLRQLLLVRIDRPEMIAGALELWQGWQDAGRDFRVGTISIEVKTTQALTSIHEFSGLHQLEPELLPSGAQEQLYLMSIGLVASNAIGETLPMVVSSIESLLKTHGNGAAIADEFLRRVSLYGRQAGSGYVHSTMRDWSVYGTRYAHNFAPRLYRINDPAMRLLTRELLSQTFAQPDGISFKMHFPEVVSAFNPIANWEAEITTLLDEH